MAKSKKGIEPGAESVTSPIPTPNTDAGEGGTGQARKSLAHPGCTYGNGSGKVPRKGQKAGPQPRLYSSDGGWVTIRGRRENLLETERKSKVGIPGLQ